MIKENILERLKQNAVCEIGNYRAIADKKMPGTYRVEFKKDGMWQEWESDLDREDAAELLAQITTGKMEGK